MNWLSVMTVNGYSGKETSPFPLGYEIMVNTSVNSCFWIETC